MTIEDAGNTGNESTEPIPLILEIPEPEPEPTEPEPAPADEAEPAGNDTVDPAPAADETTSETEPATEPEPEHTPGTSNVALQKMQQRQAAYQKQLDDVQQQLAALPDTIKGMLGNQTPAPTTGAGETPSSKATDATPAADATPQPEPDGDLAAELAEIEQAIDGLSEYDGLDKHTGKKLTGLLAKVVAKAGAAQATPQTPAQLQQVLDEVAEMKAAVSATQQKAATDKRFAELAEAYGQDVRPIWSQAEQAALKAYPEAATDPEQRKLATAHARAIFNERVSGLKPASNDTDAVDPAPAPARPGTQPRTSTAGTRPQPPGARSTPRTPSKTIPLIRET